MRASLIPAPPQVAWHHDTENEHLGMQYCVPTSLARGLRVYSPRCSRKTPRGVTTQSCWRIISHGTKPREGSVVLDTDVADSSSDCLSRKRREYQELIGLRYSIV